MESVSFLLHPRAPFSFQLALNYMKGSPGTVLERIEAGRYRRAVVLHGEPVLLAIETASEGALRVVVSGEQLAGEQLDGARRLAAQIFQTDADVSGLSDAGRADPLFARLIDEYEGLRPILLPTAFEALIWAVLGQQVNVAFAAKTKRALAERYGGRVQAGEEQFLLFPEPEALAAATAEDLLALQLSRQKARYVRELGRLVTSRELDLDRLRSEPPGEAEARLTALVGVGRWTAEYVLMRGFGHPDSIPAADGGLRQVIGRAYGFGRNATEEEVRAIAGRWNGWRGYGGFYWWYHLQAQKPAMRGLVHL